MSCAFISCAALSFYERSVMEKGGGSFDRTRGGDLLVFCIAPEEFLPLGTLDAMDFR